MATFASADEGEDAVAGKEQLPLPLSLCVCGHKNDQIQTKVGGQASLSHKQGSRLSLTAAIQGQHLVMSCYD